MKPDTVNSGSLRLLQQLHDASVDGKLSIGIKAVWNTATHRRGALLIVEEEYPFNNKEVIDDIMEKVLRTGGDVEFVQPGMLDAYQHIVLVE